jgi:hypothetical protein
MSAALRLTAVEETGAVGQHAMTGRTRLNLLRNSFWGIVRGLEVGHRLVDGRLMPNCVARAGDGCLHEAPIVSRATPLQFEQVRWPEKEVSQTTGVRG